MIVSWRGVAVDLTGPEDALDGLRQQLPAFLGSDGEIVARGLVQRAGDVLALDLPDGLGVEVADDAEFFRAAASRVELTLAHHVPDRVVVHAGVVAHSGRAILLPGRSLAGKSTLVRALIDAGATYWSDDLAPLNADGAVYPYPRAMTRRTATGSVRQLLANAAQPEHEALPVAVVALLQHDSTRGWDIGHLTAGRAVLGLVDNCLSVRRDPAFSLDVLTKTAQLATCVQGTRGEAEQAAEALLEMLR